MLRALYPGRMRDDAALAAAAKTVDNASNAASVVGVTASTPAGVLAGYGAKIVGNNQVSVTGTGSTNPCSGIFAFDYNQSDLLPSAAETTIGQLPFYESGTFEVSVYHDVTYTAGELLYFHPTYHCLTNVKPSTVVGSANNWAQGIVVQAPTANPDSRLKFTLVSPFIAP